MPSIADHCESLRHRFCAESAPNIARTRQSFEEMEAVAAAERPACCRCGYFEISGVPFLVWEMDEAGDRFEIFATAYNISIGSLRLSDNPAGLMQVAGFYIELAALVVCIKAYFKPENGRIAGDTREKKKLLLFGFSESFGHHFWNEVSGLASAIATGLLQKLDGVILGPFDYFHFGPWFEAQGKPVWKMNAISPLVTPNRLLRYHSSVVIEEARRLVLENTRRDTGNPPPAPAAGRSISFQIRRHRRRWIHEEEKLEKILAACAGDWPDHVFYIEGHSTSKGAINIKQEEIANESALVARLQAKLARVANIRSLIGMDMNEKINILKHVDLFVGPIGSGGVLSAWVLRKPTVVYGHSSTYPMMDLQETTVSEGGRLGFPVPVEHIRDYEDKSFDLDAEPILRQIRAVAQSYGLAATGASSSNQQVNL